MVSGIKGLPGQTHPVLVGRGDRLVLQKIADGFFQPLCQIPQGIHRGPGGTVFNLGQHIPCDDLAAKLPLGQARFQPGKAQFFAQFHSMSSR